MTIHFTNGKTRHISKDIATIIKDRIIQGCGKFQIFSDENNDVILFINLDEVCYID